MGARRIAGLVFWALLLAFPLTLPAQDEGAAASARKAPGKAQTDAQKMGEAIFAKNCHLCHIYSAQKTKLKILASTELIGLFKERTTTEDGVRQLIQQGIPQRMPSFRYN